MRQERGEANGGTDRLVWQPGQVVVPAELRTDVSAHGFWKRGTTAMFDIRIVNLDAGSYLRMMPEKALSNSEKERRTCTFRLAWSIGGILLPWSTMQTEYPERRP